MIDSLLRSGCLWTILQKVESGLEVSGLPCREGITRMMVARKWTRQLL